MTIALHGKQITTNTLSLIKEIMKIANHYQTKVIVSNTFMELLQGNSRFTMQGLTTFSAQQIPHSLGLLISIGGDGTLLEAATYISNTKTPLLGINTGNLGFLATVIPENAATALTKFLKGEYMLDKRTMLALSTQKQPVGFALNEVAMLRSDNSSMITLHAYVDDVLINIYWADGLMVATPTGSTGYSLSCGGPIVLPSTNDLIITPISPHNLSVRPLIIPDNTTLTFTVKSRSPQILIALDGRAMPMSTDTQFTIKKANFVLNLVKIAPTTIFDVLREKLHWGADIRN